MARTKKSPLTVEQIREKVHQEIPYTVGDGRHCLNERTKRIKYLMRKNGHSTVVTPFIPDPPARHREGSLYDLYYQ